MLRRLANLLGMAGAGGVCLLQMVGRRRALVSALVGTALVVVAAGVVPFLDDYLTLRRQRESLTALAPRLGWRDLPVRRIGRS